MDDRSCGRFKKIIVGRERQTQNFDGSQTRGIWKLDFQRETLSKQRFRTPSRTGQGLLYEHEVLSQPTTLKTMEPRWN